MTDQHPGVRIRTVTASLPESSLVDHSVTESSLAFLTTARDAFVEAGYEVQTLRLATPSLAGRVSEMGREAALEALQSFDRALVEADVLASAGSLLAENRADLEFSAWAATLAARTVNLSFSVCIAAPEVGPLPGAAETAAATIRAISQVGTNGEANFRFAAAANIPPGTPFFPVAHSAGAPSFSIGLESAPLVERAFVATDNPQAASDHLKIQFEEALEPIEKLARELADRSQREYRGIDVSPAPGLDASIAAGIERLTGEPFGAPSTLAACATITTALEQLSIQKCGYSGLMLPLLEDKLLAERAAEGRFGVRHLLLYSSVCGTGLDVVPLPGNAGQDELAGLLQDVAALAARWNKPLSARLLPIPGAVAGQTVSFDNPHLTDSVVMPIS